MLECRLGIKRHRKTDIEDMGRILHTFQTLLVFGVRQLKEDVRWIKRIFGEHGPYSVFCKNLTLKCIYHIINATKLFE